MKLNPQTGRVNIGPGINKLLQYRRDNLITKSEFFDMFVELVDRAKAIKRKSSK